MQTLGFYLTVDHVHMRLKDAVKQLCEGRTAGSRGSDVTAKSGTSKPVTPRDATAALTLGPTARRELITAAEHIVSALQCCLLCIMLYAGLMYECVVLHAFQ
jgi:hypothetical protein